MHLIKYTLSVFFVYSLIATTSSANENTNLLLYDAFHDAIISDSFIEVREFLKLGADLNYKYNGGLTPLMIAVNTQSERSVKTLIDLGANIQIKSNERKTALDYAEQNSNKVILSLLNKYSFTNKPLVKEIQYYLLKLKYKTGKIDGIIGNKTTTALKKFANDTQQTHPAEISHRQVEILKNTYFQFN